MPIPRVVRRWNKVGLNRISKRIAPQLPGFGVVVHRGRRSGRRYETPVNVFPAADGYVLALTYGPDTDWVRTCWPQAAASSGRGAARCRSPRRGYFATRAGITFAPLNGRYCGSSA